MSKREPWEKIAPEEHWKILLSGLDQDNFDDLMPRELLAAFIREEGGDPDVIWKRMESWIDQRLATRAQRVARNASES